ncbi:site-specific integrase [Kineosporia sp. A_224]|uniref:tyrosine-type recombinase/integrase n=1 Tax=Kineosporia sp. A_224 TaxID=1962180 RepID=UPI000B4B67D6|nr:site-specific integrase [Kineosporia sp. A_224]
MPKSWSDAVKQCHEHPRKVNGRWCSCRSGGWRYRMGLPDPVTGLVGRPTWSETFPTKDAADRNQRAVRQAISDNTYVQDRGYTVAEYLEQWLELKKTLGRKPSTVQGYEGVIRVHLISKLGRHRLRDLRPDHVQGMLDLIAREPARSWGKQHVTPTAGTLVNVRAVLRAALNDAVRRQLITRNVATLVALPAAKRRKPVALTDDRLRLFLEEAAGHPFELLWFVVSVYGMRRGESCGLRWRDVDETRRVIEIRQTIVDVEGAHECDTCGGSHRRILFDTPKSLAGERIYPLVPAVASALAEQRRRQDAQRELHGRDYRDHDLVFALPDGSPIRPDAVSNQFRAVIKRSGAAEGLDRVPSLKALRSTAVTNLHEAGTPLEVISRVTGHSGGEVTRTHYLHVSAERTRLEFGALADRIGPKWSGRSDHQSDHRASEEPAEDEGETVN